MTRGKLTWRMIVMMHLRYYWWTTMWNLRVVLAMATSRCPQCRGVGYPMPEPASVHKMDCSLRSGGLGWKPYRVQKD